MKNLLRFSLLIIIGFSFVQSQPLKSFGIKFGGTLATQRWTFAKGTPVTTGYRFGPAGGLFIEGLKAGNVSVLGEFWYIQKGLSVTFNAVPVQPSVIYLSLPFLMKYRIEDDGVTYYGLAGPRIDYLFHIDPQSYTPLTDALSEGNSDVGVTAGLGVQVFNTVLLEARFSPSLIPAFKNDSLTVTNTSFEFIVGFSF
jgi:hypothetical protein